MINTKHQTQVMTLPTNVFVVKPNSDDFLYLTKTLYAENEIPHTNQPNTSHLINCYVFKANNVIVGRFALYHNLSIKIDNQKTCIVGSYECVNDLELSQALILNIKIISKQLNTTKLIGPMEGSTWQNYRFTTSKNTPLFFTESCNKPYYSNQFINGGFNELSTYSSTLDSNIECNLKRLKQFKEKFEPHNLIIRNLNLDDFENELIKIGQFCNATFNSNYLFSTLDPNLFAKKYRTIKSKIEAELFIIVEDEKGEVQAFLFSIPNYLDTSKKSIIIKSMATLPKRHLAGLQIYLGELMYSKAISMGYSKAIHAYMIEDNMSKGLSRKFNSEPYKKHILYQMDI